LEGDLLEKNQLKRGLLSRHVHMMAIGGSIGAGLFKGSSETIQLAGPSVVLSYLCAGILLFIVMGALGEMASIYPHLDLRGLLNRAYGYKLSFVTGWLYWFNWIIITSVEVIAASSFLSYWFPLVPYG
jgi:AAT family amino acid transporter